MKYLYSAVILPDEECGFIARVPDLPGCVTTGKDLAEAIYMITDAASGWLCVAEDKDVSIPSPSSQSDLSIDPGATVTVISVDTIAYRAATDTRAVRKNVSLPAWMAAMADKRHINCSQVLQDGLTALLS